MPRRWPGFLSWALGEDLFERGDDPSGIGHGAAVAARYADHAEVADRQASSDDAAPVSAPRTMIVARGAALSE
jgi:hypothetical protein